MSTAYSAVTFVGKQEYLTTGHIDGFVFDKYLDIVNTGVQEFGEAFSSVFHKTTGSNQFPILAGSYAFVDPGQQNAR